MKKLILISALLIFACDLFSQNNSLPNWIPADGLYGYWPLDGNINDLSGNENHGTSDGQYSTDTYENGNQSVYLQNQMIILPINSDLNIDNFTVQFWTKAVSYNIHNKVQVADPSGLGVGHKLGILFLRYMVVTFYILFQVSVMAHMLIVAII